MTLAQLLSELDNLSSAGRGFKPHKHLALMAVMRLIRKRQVTTPDVRFDANFKDAFKELLKDYGTDSDRNRPHTPFFHLASTNFWTLISNSGCEEDLIKAISIGSAGDLTRLVHHAQLDKSVFALMANEQSSNTIRTFLENVIVEGQSAKRSTVHETRANYSLFSHEARAIEWLDTRRGAAQMVHNFHLHDQETNRILECDAILVAGSGVYMVELKHWSGDIKVSAYNWLLNGWEHRKNPHYTNVYKAKVLKGLIQHTFPHLPFFYVTSVVVLTNEDAQVKGGDTPSTKRDNPTFDGLPTFIRYLKAQRKTKGTLLSASQVTMIAERLEALRKEGPRGQNITFPGYETLDVISCTKHQVEVVVRPEFAAEARCQRIRLFYPPRLDDPNRKHLIQRSRNTIKAIAQIGEHPNILPVVSMPHDEGVIAECSDWSVSGTLRDRLDVGPLSVSDALKIVEGILHGLDAAHQAGVVHRALCPENVLLKGDVPRLMNFDLSYQLDEIGTHVTVIPEPSELPRSPYIAPEVLAGKDIDSATDLFSLGVILFEMLTGSPPFKAPSDLAATGGSLPEKAIAALTDAPLGVPEGIIELIQLLIQFDRTERPSDAVEVAGLLEESLSVPVASAADVEIGDSYDCYKIDGRISRGQQAILYVVVGIGGEKLVMKLFDHDVSVDRIQREEQAAGLVRSPYLLHARHTIHWQSSRYGILFDYVNGPSLREQIRKEETPTYAEFLSATRSILQALSALHEPQENDDSGLLHNDIKPENVLLAAKDHLVLIDFGSAWPPGVRAFRGTEGYAAPDLRLGCDFNHCPGGDCFALGVTLFEWYFGVYPFVQLVCGATIADVSLRRENINPGLMNWFKVALETDADKRFASAQEMLDDLLAASTEPEEQPAPEPKVEKAPAKILEPKTEEGNPFIAYLNSLHGASAASSGMLAESQATSTLFADIHVSSAIAADLADSITAPDAQHVILTGHAGDGKSTIALEVFKRIKGIPIDTPLASTPDQHEVVNVGKGMNVHIVKDMSELPLVERVELICKARDAIGSKRYLIVSNTGALLAAFKAALSPDTPEAELEDQLLNALSSRRATSISIAGKSFRIINLAQCSHIDLAIEVLARMVDHDRWNLRPECGCRTTCPIYRNAELIRENWETVSDRIRMVYERLHLYRKRLTMRQMVAHLAYAITSGLACPEIPTFSKGDDPAKHLFINRLFGDTGRERDTATAQFVTIRHLRAARMGQSSSAGIERLLWLDSITTDELGIPADAEDIFRTLHASAMTGNGMPRQSARIQLRRLIYFLGAPDTSTPAGKIFEQFTTRFIGSPLLREYMSWQDASEYPLSKHRTRRLLTRVLHVLQEQFTGTRLPESMRFDGPLYVTLNRHNHDIRQTAQVVLASFPAQDFTLRLVDQVSPTGTTRRILVLAEQRSGEELELGLPFLDYVMLRHEGMISSGLQCSYLDRLESFKARLLACHHGYAPHNIMLVRLETNHAFRSHEIEVTGDRLEVLQ